MKSSFFGYASTGAITLLLLAVHVGCGGATEGGTVPASLDGGADANDNTCGDFAQTCFAESDGGCTGSPVYPSCVNGQVQCPAGTIAQSACPAPAGYLACMDSQGTIDASMKACQTDADCVIETEQTDCCGTELYVGISTSSTSAFSTCETSWKGHFPGCGCPGGLTQTEDGKTPSPEADGGAPAVHCVDFTSSGGVCETYVP